jgi:hypothetical protein
MRHCPNPFYSHSIGDNLVGKHHRPKILGNVVFTMVAMLPKKERMKMVGRRGKKILSAKLLQLCYLQQLAS